MSASLETSPAARVIPARLLDVARGLISVALGLGLLARRSQTITILVGILALYVLMDGLFDILIYLRRRRRQDIGLTRLITSLSVVWPPASSCWPRRLRCESSCTTSRRAPASTAS